MNETTAETEPTTATPADIFREIASVLGNSGAGAAVDLLIREEETRGDYRGLLDALLLKARLDLGLSAAQPASFAELPEEIRTRYEERYVEAIKRVGGKLLDKGDIAGAWPYFRAIGEAEAVAKAIDAFEPTEDDPRVNSVVEVAFNHGANPRKGFELILRHYGTCSAITAFEQLPRDESVRSAAAAGLIRQLHEHLTANIRAEIAHRGQPLPPEGTPIEKLVEGREWLFTDDAYHIDVSHLSATVRVSPLVNDPAVLALALDLTEYGKRLSPRHRYEGECPFEDTFGDHNVFLKALLGRGVDSAIAHFRAKLDTPEAPVEDVMDGEYASNRRREEKLATAQVLVGLLARIGRMDEAIDLSAEHLAGIPEASLFCPGLSQLCQRAGKPERLAAIARSQGDLVNFTAALIQSRPQS